MLRRTALDDIEPAEMPLNVTVIDTEQTARTRRFAGSPAFLADDIDLSATDQSDGSTARRVYPTPDGPRNVPPLRDLPLGLKAHAARTARVRP